MFEKCDAKCDAFGFRNIPHLWLRKNVFYCRIELPKKDSKRRYGRYSLHTNNYYEALTKMDGIKQFNVKFNRLCELYSQISVIRRNVEQIPGHSIMTFYVPDELVLSPNNKPETLIEFIELFAEIKQGLERYNVNKEVANNLKTMETKLNLIEKKLGPEAFAKLIQTNAPQVKETPKHTLKEILDIMLLRANNKEDEKTRKRNFLSSVFDSVNLNLESDYLDFYKPDIISKISESIVNKVGVKNDNRRQKLRYITEFVNCACNVEPDFYKNNLILNLPKITKTKKSDRKPHLPYSEEQLKEIFDTKHKFFDENPDVFWICMIALFTGARLNAATTLQYGDVFEKDKLKCLYFRSNHAIKHLKNDASERIVPIHKQLLDLGFWDYVECRKKKLKAKDEDFIFPKCKTKSGEYNDRYMLRTLFVFLEELDIKEKGLDFHSFRKNASLAMQSAGLVASCINRIIGWEGTGTMEQSYSNYTLQQINTELNKFSYSYLQTEFDEWKKIMEKKN